MAYLNPNEVSIVHWFPDLEKHKCGYCKDENGSMSYGMWAETMTPQDYQNLIDRGWRRSGKYCYKPVMNKTCCPQYTIRCNAMKFSPSKSQKKVIKRFNKFCTDGIFNKERDSEANHQGVSETEGVFEMVYKEGPTLVTDLSQIHKENPEIADHISLKSTETDVPESITTASASQTNEANSSSKENVHSKETTKFKGGVGADPNRPPCKKARLLRLEKKQNKLLQRGMSLEKLNTDPQVKSLAQFLQEIPENACHKIRIKMIPTSEPGAEWERAKEIEFELYRKYQMKIHNDPSERCTMHGFTRFLVNSPLKISTEAMHRKHCTYKASANLYKKYQMAIHNETAEDCSEKQFLDFLVDSPLERVAFEDGTGGVGYGSYHQQYWLDDSLIAVGVIDILPKCISSVYFFYDPDYRNLTLGTYGCLRELQFTLDIHEMNPRIEYYYMGYYIHSCPKMRYKGKLSMSDLLCPETYTWCPIEKCIPKLEASKYARLNENLNTVDKDLCTLDDVDNIKILLGYKFTVFRTYKVRHGEEEIFANIGKLVGKRCARSLLVVK